jgi:hypothetical protein
MKDATDITLLLDRSGSMESIATDTVGGINTFIKEQQALPGEATFSLVLFDSHGYDRIIDCTPIRDVQPLAGMSPRASTPLLDSMARTIDETGARLAAVPEDRRPAHVVVVTVTDGLENASVTFTREQVFAKVKHQIEHYGWLFLYLGANQDAIAVGHDLGIAAQHAGTYGLTGQHVNSAYQNTSAKVGDFRAGMRGMSVGFTAAERSAMDDDDSTYGTPATGGSTYTTTTTKP